MSLDGQSYWDGDVWQWQPLWLRADEIAHAALEQSGRKTLALHFLAAGMLNQSWRIDTHDGSYVLRLSRQERSRDQVAYEHDALKLLREHVTEVVAPLAGKNGETIQLWDGHLLSLFPFIEGVTGEAVDRVERWLQAADVMARLHRASLNHTHLGQRPGFQSLDAEWRSIWHTVSPILRRDLAGRNGFDDLSGTLSGEVTSLERWLDQLHESDRTVVQTTIHGDLNPRNLIFREGRIVAVIDWDDCRVDPIAWEVAQTAFEASDADRFAFWSAYLDAGGPLLSSDIDLLPNLARIGALLQLQYTEKHGQATPHSMQQLAAIADALSRISEFDR